MTISSRTWSVRARQCLLTAALATPLVIAIATAPPFEAEARAGFVPGMLGPAFPIVAGSDNIVPTRSGNTITVVTPWICGETSSTLFTLSNPDGSGRFRTVTRDLGTLRQTLTFTAFSGGSPSEASETETRAGVTVNSSVVTMLDTNGDGVFDAARFTGQHNVTLSLVFSDDRVSIPWSQASAVGLRTTSSCAGTMPQTWVPLADTNGDGRGDALVFDLDGNGVADADMYSGPIVAVPPVPTMSAIARLVLMMLIGLTGSWFLSRRRGNIGGTPA
jgi:hypothetical protein